MASDFKCRMPYEKHSSAPLRENPQGWRQSWQVSGPRSEKYGLLGPSGCKFQDLDLLGPFTHFLGDYLQNIFRILIYVYVPEILFNLLIRWENIFQIWTDRDFFAIRFSEFWS